MELRWMNGKLQYRGERDNVSAGTEIFVKDWTEVPVVELEKTLEDKFKEAHEQWGLSTQNSLELIDRLLQITSEHFSKKDKGAGNG